MLTLIKNGTIVTVKSEYKADLLIEDEKIKAIGNSFSEVVNKEIDAMGMYVLPGGVDQHTHYDALNSDGVTSNAGYETSFGAIVGGTTTIVDFAAQDEGKGLIDSIEHRKEFRTKGKIATDYSIHALCTNVNESIVKEIPELPKHGVPTLKLFMAYKPSPLYVNDAELFRFMRISKDYGITIYVHAENADLLNLFRDEAYAKGNIEPKYHWVTRPPFVEAEATQRAITLADEAKVPLCVVHVSCKQSAEKVRGARNNSQAVIGETCTHYLILDKSRLENTNFDESSRYVCSPPLRSIEDQEYLWNALNKDTLSIISSDHCGIPLYQKHWGKTDFRAIPNGCPGAGDRLQMMWTYGVETKKITRQRLVEIYAMNPAQLCGLFPRKGTIEVGSDADIVIYNPNYRGNISLKSNPNGLEYNIYEGLETIGRAEVVLLRGQVVVQDHKYVGSPGEGKFIPGEPYGLAYNLL